MRQHLAGLAVATALSACAPSSVSTAPQPSPATTSVATASQPGPAPTSTGPTGPADVADPYVAELVERAALYAFDLDTEVRAQADADPSGEDPVGVPAAVRYLLGDADEVADGVYASATGTYGALIEADTSRGAYLLRADVDGDFVEGRAVGLWAEFGRNTSCDADEVAVLVVWPDSNDPDDEAEVVLPPFDGHPDAARLFDGSPCAEVDAAGVQLPPRPPPFVYVPSAQVGDMLAIEQLSELAATQREHFELAGTYSDTPVTLSRIGLRRLPDMQTGTCTYDGEYVAAAKHERSNVTWATGSSHHGAVAASEWASFGCDPKVPATQESSMPDGMPEHPLPTPPPDGPVVYNELSDVVRALRDVQERFFVSTGAYTNDLDVLTSFGNLTLPDDVRVGLVVFDGPYRPAYVVCVSSTPGGTTWYVDSSVNGMVMAAEVPQGCEPA